MTLHIVICMIQMYWFQMVIINQGIDFIDLPVSSVGQLYLGKYES